MLTTRFGQVVVSRIAYRARAAADLHPGDAVLNLPAEKHSHGLRRLAALEAARGSFEDAAAAIGRATTVQVGKRQVEQLAAAAAVDVDGFYAAHAPAPAPADDVLVLSFDAKGVVMRPDGLRAATATAAASQKLTGRLSKGEKRNRKRMAEVAAVYDLTPVPRTVDDILPEPDRRGAATPAPTAAGKWLHASVGDDRGNTRVDHTGDVASQADVRAALAIRPGALVVPALPRGRPHPQRAAHVRTGIPVPPRPTTAPPRRCSHQLKPAIAGRPTGTSRHRPRLRDLRPEPSGS
jgi:hypothetical protein